MSEAMDVAIPILPCRNLAELRTFYSRLGFSVVLAQETPDVYAILRRGPLELHFFGFPTLNPSTAYTGAYLRVENPDTFYEEYQSLGLPETHGAPCLGAIEDKPWGMREFYVMDPAGNLLRFGRPLAG